MAGIMMLSAMDDDRRRKKREREQIALFKKREEIVSMSARNIKNNETSYGLMSYVTWCVQSHVLSNFEIYYTSTDINIVIENTKKEIRRTIKNNRKLNLLFYCVHNIDPRLVSYRFIIRSNLQWLDIVLDNKPKFCKFYGDTELCRQLYDKLDFLKEYDLYMKNLSRLSKKDLKGLYYQTFRKSAMLLTKKSIWKKLLKCKRRNILL
jgi:hypothetical protein